MHCWQWAKRDFELPPTYSALLQLERGQNDFRLSYLLVLRTRLLLSCLAGDTVLSLADVSSKIL